LTINTVAGLKDTIPLGLRSTTDHFVAANKMVGGARLRDHFPEGRRMVGDGI
jgi:hypothetical protein